MRRIGALMLLSVLGLALAAPVTASTTISVHGYVKENYGRAPSDIPCEFDETTFALTCFGFGNAGRFGPLTSEVVFDETGGITRTLTFRDGSTITLAEEYFNFRTPGGSGQAPGAFRSFGNPFHLDGTWEAIGGTGGLAGVTGSGTIEQIGAGNTIQIWFDGTITLP